MVWKDRMRMLCIRVMWMMFKCVTAAKSWISIVYVSVARFQDSVLIYNLLLSIVKKTQISINYRETSLSWTLSWIGKLSRLDRWLVYRGYFRRNCVFMCLVNKGLQGVKDTVLIEPLMITLDLYTNLRLVWIKSKALNWIPYFRKFKFVRVCFHVGRYFYNVYIVKRLQLCCFLHVKDN